MRELVSVKYKKYEIYFVKDVNSVSAQIIDKTQNKPYGKVVDTTYGFNKFDAENKAKKIIRAIK